jgi:hypothetical protein
MTPDGSTCSQPWCLLALIAVVFNGGKLPLVLTNPKYGLDGVSKRKYSAPADRLAHTLVCVVTTEVDQ